MQVTQRNIIRTHTHTYIHTHSPSHTHTVKAPHDVDKDFVEMV